MPSSQPRGNRTRISGRVFHQLLVRPWQATTSLSSPFGFLRVSFSTPERFLAVSEHGPPRVNPNCAVKSGIRGVIFGREKCRMYGYKYWTGPGGTQASLGTLPGLLMKDMGFLRVLRNGMATISRRSATHLSTVANKALSWSVTQAPFSLMTSIFNATPSSRLNGRFLTVCSRTDFGPDNRPVPPPCPHAASPESVAREVQSLSELGCRLFFRRGHNTQELTCPAVLPFSADPR
ncbi:hypothetical protein VUR80DRAFT_2805 [Thermomyces stellatus]